MSRAAATEEEPPPTPTGGRERSDRARPGRFGVGGHEAGSRDPAHAARFGAATNGSFTTSAGTARPRRSRERGVPGALSGTGR